MLRQPRARLSAGKETARAFDYGLKRRPALIRFHDGRLCMSDNAAERALSGVAVGRNNWTFAGSESGGERAAAFSTLIEAAELNDADPRARLAGVPALLPDHPVRRIQQLPPWNRPTASLATTTA
jgi:transposase